MSSSYAVFAAPTAEASSTLRSLRRVLDMQRIEREQRARRRRNLSLLAASVLSPLVAWTLFVA